MTKMTKAHFKNAATGTGKSVHGLMDIGDGKLKPIWVTGIADGIVEYKDFDDANFHYMKEEVFMKCVYKDPFWERL